MEATCVLKASCSPTPDLYQIEFEKPEKFRLVLTRAQTR